MSKKVDWKAFYADRFYTKNPVSGQPRLEYEKEFSILVSATNEFAAQKKAAATLRKKHPSPGKTRWSWHEWEIKSIERDR